MKAVCIGGPLDGEYHDKNETYIRGVPSFYVETMNSFSFCSEQNKTDPMYRCCNEHWYTLKTVILFGVTIDYYEYSSVSNGYTKDSAFVRNLVSRFKERNNQRAKYYHIIEELENIIMNEPMSDGDSISSASLRACFDIGYAKRENDMVVSTGSGKHIIEMLKKAYIRCFDKS
jgi:hypothetical protein